MRNIFLAAGLLLLCGPLRAVEPIPSVPRIEAALQQARAPAHVIRKVRASVAYGAVVVPETVGERYASVNRHADAVIARYLRAGEPESRKAAVADAWRILLADDGSFVSHGREKTLNAVARDQAETAASRQGRRLKLVAASAILKAREEARKLREREAERNSAFSDYKRRVTLGDDDPPAQYYF